MPTHEYDDEGERGEGLRLGSGAGGELPGQWREVPERTQREEREKSGAETGKDEGEGG